MTLLFLIHLALVIPNLSEEQTDCKTHLLGYIDQMAQMNEPEPGKVFYLDFSINYELNPNVHEPVQEVSTITNKVFISSNQYINFGNKISVFQDKQEVFIILHPEKRIIWMDGYENYDGNVNLQAQIDFQKEVINSGSINSCLTKDSSLDIQLSVSENVKEEHNISSLRFEFDKRNELKKMITQYTPKNAIRNQTIIYNEMDLDKKGWVSLPLRDYVFSSNGNLRKEYVGYQVLNEKMAAR